MTTATALPHHTDDRLRADAEIDLIDPTEACRLLGIDDRRLLDLVNGARLAAFDLDGHLRFRSADVRAVAAGWRAAGPGDAVAED